VAEDTTEIEWLEPAELAVVGAGREVVLHAGGDDDERRAPSDRALAAARRRGQWRVQYQQSRQLRVGVPSPRVDSVVRRVLHCGVDEAVDQVHERLARARGLDLFEPLEPDPLVPRLRAPGALVVPFSRPRLPVWLAVEPWWRRQSQVTLWLRSTRRWRYPARYFKTAHRAMDQLTRPLERLT